MRDTIAMSVITAISIFFFVWAIISAKTHIELMILIPLSVLAYIGIGMVLNDRIIRLKKNNQIGLKRLD